MDATPLSLKTSRFSRKKKRKSLLGDHPEIVFWNVNFLKTIFQSFLQNLLHGFCNDIICLFARSITTSIPWKEIPTTLMSMKLSR